MQVTDIWAPKEKTIIYPLSSFLNNFFYNKNVIKVLSIIQIRGDLWYEKFF